MGIYSGFNYGAGVKYGYESRIEYSVEPMTAVALDYNDILVQWSNPSGTVLGMRLVRNQDGYAESEEDGTIVLDKYSFSSVTTYLRDDGAAGSFEQGRYVYYTLWLMLSDYTWIPAGWTYTLLPKEHNVVTDDGVVLQSSVDRFAHLLPKVFTTQAQHYLDELDTSSDLYQFVSGFALTVDELETFADLLVPGISGDGTNPNTLGVKAYQYGVLPESEIGMQRQKRLVREATYLYKYKGTSNGIQTLAESITNYSPTVTLSPNILLSSQDSTFYKGVGNWVAGTNGTLSVDSTWLATHPVSETYSVDKTYCGKIITTGSNVVMTNGMSTPLLTGTPVVPGTNYSFSFYVSSPAATGTVATQITWYDYRGEVISTSSGGGATATTATMTKQTVTGLTAPGKSVAITNYVLNTGVVTLTLGSGHGFSTGNTIFVTGVPAKDSSTAFGVSINGKFTVTGTTATEVTYAFVGFGNIASTAVTTGTASSLQAAFAGIQLTISSAGTYYFDNLQLIDSTSSLTSVYNEARGVEVYLAPSKTNYLLNPSFETNLTSWSFNQATATRTSDTTLTLAPHGTYIASLATTSTASTAVSPTFSTSVANTLSTGQFVTFSCYAKVTAGTLNTMTLRLSASDSGSSLTTYNEVLLDSGTATASRPGLTTSWKKIEVNLFVPAEYVSSTTTITAALYGNAGSKTIWIEAAQLETGYTSTDYFDGSLVSRGASWTGTANASSSILYVSKSVRISRLLRDLPNFLPVNTPYVVTSGPTSSKTVESYGYSS